MVFSYTQSGHGVDGNRAWRKYTLTNVQNDGTSKVYTSFKKIFFVDSINQTDIADTFKQSWAGGVVTLTAVTNDDDGEITVWGLL